jgi:hypothetical protein
MTIHRTVRLDVGYGGQGAILEIGKEVGDVPHVIGPHGIVQLILKRVADVAIEAIQGSAGSRDIVAAAIILPQNVIGAKQVANASHRHRRDAARSTRSALGCPRRVDVDGIVIVILIAFRINGIGQLVEIAEDDLDARL